MSHFDCFLVRLLVLTEISQLKAFRPVSFVQVHQHGLLKVRLAIVDSNGIIMPIKSVDECLYRRLVNMTDVRSSLSGFATGNDGVGVY